jgi:membrane protease YdiL (CAAX protease family)
MLFTLKRRWPHALLGVVVLAALGFGLRSLLDGTPALTFSPRTLLFGVAAFAVVVVSDVLLHGIFCAVFGSPYRQCHRELVELFRGQSLVAILAGAAMAGLGEEPLFRGLSCNPLYLVLALIPFGLLHHVRRSLWPFTVWAAWQGVLLAAALYVTGDLGVAMVAHFLHDLSGFLAFRYLNGRTKTAGSSVRGSGDQ